MSNVSSRLSRAPERSGGSRQVRLRLVYIDFWSTVKLSLMLSIALAIVNLVAIFLLWIVLNQLGVFEQVGTLLQRLLYVSQAGLLDSLGLLQVMLFALIWGVIIVIFGTALGACAALLYNLSVRLTGGLLVGFTNA